MLLFDKAGVAHGNVPGDLSPALDRAHEKGLTVRSVAFTGPDKWICLANGGWWTNDAQHPAAKMIADLEQHQPLHWVAIAPQFAPHDFQKWAAIVRRQCAGKLAGGYAFAVWHRGQRVADGAAGWARAPWEKEHPSIPWTLDKPMGVASVSKTITAVALLKLWEESGHKFSLDDPFWPHLKPICPRASADVKTVTIRQLLNHKSGFKKQQDHTTPQDLKSCSPSRWSTCPARMPSTTTTTSTSPGWCCEQIGHVDYTAYVKQHVLRPLGITRMETHFQAHEPTCGYGKPGSKRRAIPSIGSVRPPQVPRAGLPRSTTWASSCWDYATTKCSAPARPKSCTATCWVGTRPSRAGKRTAAGRGMKAGATGSRGSLCSSIWHFPDDVDAVMLINCEAPDGPEDILRDAWTESMRP